MWLSPENAFLVTITLVLTGFVWLPIWWLLDILTPKSMLERYFKEPYFSRGELIALNLFPASLMRVSIFGWTLWFPSLSKKRQMKNLEKGTPRWYSIALKVFTVCFMTHGFLIITSLISLLVYIEFFGD
ncbi:MAG: hypothetical protein KTR20_10450 [Cellvibrionaceae bacterium]|nr:hypothetical protein [Cellvibrionaceae bacterium]